MSQCKRAFVRPGDIEDPGRYEFVVSACLVGLPCRYDGYSHFCPQVYSLWEEGKACAVCPEGLAGLPIPRLPCELVEGDVISRDGEDLSYLFRQGVARALAITRAVGARKAIVKSRSPSCGLGEIYDGTFSRTLCHGNGLWTEALLAEVLSVVTEEKL